MRQLTFGVNFFFFFFTDDGCKFGGSVYSRQCMIYILHVVTFVEFFSSCS